MESNVAISVFFVFLWKHNLEINSLVNRHTREVLSNIGKPHSNLYKTYSVKHGKRVTVLLLTYKNSHSLSATRFKSFDHLLCSY